jgi:hypothetical protein
MFQCVLEAGVFHGRVYRSEIECGQNCLSKKQAARFSVMRSSPELTWRLQVLHDRTLGGSRVQIKPQWHTSLCTPDLLATEELHLVRLLT